jgi:hypothetical protein
MNFNWSLFKSRLFWSAAVLGLYNCLIVAGTFYVSPYLTDVINILGFILITYLHVNPSQQYNTGSIKK